MRSQVSDDWTFSEIAIAVVTGFLLCAGLSVYAIGAVAGGLFGGGVPSTAIEQLPAIAARIPTHLDDPQQAWPASARRVLPDLGAFAAAAAILVAGLATMTVAGFTMARRWSSRSRRGARWSTARQIRALRVRAASRGRLVLGRHGRHLVAAEPRQSVIVVAPTQTGKTTGLAVPAILEWRGPVLATSVKTDLVADTLAQRKHVGQALVFDPTATTGLQPAQWTPLAGCVTWQGARETADRLCSVAKPGHGMSDGDFWSAAAARYLAPLMFVAATEDLTMADVVHWVDSDHRDIPSEVLAGLSYTKDPAVRVAASSALAALQGIWEGDDRLRSSLAATAGVALNAYGDPLVAATAQRSELTPAWLLAGLNTAYLCATATGQERLRPLFVTLIDQVVEHVYECAAQRGGPIDPPLLIVLDEAANIAPLPRLDQLAATGAGQGIQLVTVVQDMAQIEHRWGRKSDTIVNNHRAKLFGSGISCEKTLGYLTRLLGDETIEQRSVTRGERGRKSTTAATTHRPLGPADRLRQVDADTAVLVYGNLPPARLALRPWYRDRHLRRLAGQE